jgi:hypothetical protein
VNASAPSWRPGEIQYIKASHPPQDHIFHITLSTINKSLQHLPHSSTIFLLSIITLPSSFDLNHFGLQHVINIHSLILPWHLAHLSMSSNLNYL